MEERRAKIAIEKGRNQSHHILLHGKKNIDATEKFNVID